ncbi:unnamed protein product [Orchesella dallaii]|uniref:C2H2-type domain-containing protein n=1 Tax=Orchesella dallaii TaxID=48710 RepID=A0ABP1R4N0_9HEXA
MLGDIRCPPPGPSNSRPFDVGVGIPAPARVVGNRPLYSSALSDCWNSSSSNTPTASTSASARAALNELSTTCLFCPNNVKVPNPLIREPPGVLGRRNKLLKNLCFHLEINAKELPKDGTRATFPFCPGCDKNVKDLMTYHEELEKVKEKISQAVTRIERIVADRQILGNKEPRTPIERQKFVKLYDMIMEGFRNKLLKRQLESNNLFPNHSQMGGLRNGSNGRNSQQLQTGITITPSPSSSGGGVTEQGCDGVEILEDKTVHMDPLDVGAETEVEDVPLNPNFPSPSPDINDQEEEENSGEIEDESSVHENDNLSNNMEEQEEQQNLISNDSSNCNLVISNVKSRAETSASVAGSSRAGNRSGNRNRNPNRANPPPQVIGVVNVPNVKQEPMDEEEESEDEVGDGDGTSAAVFAMADPKRKLLYEGIEILKVSGTGSRKNEEFIQCSVCDFTLHVPKVTRREAKGSDELSPHMKMKKHILNVHKKIPGPVKPRAKPQFICGCDITFPNLATLKQHNKVHRHTKYLPCNICGRPIKGGTFNLRMHKHSHKNDEERKLALKNGERGAYNSFLSSKIESVYRRKMRKQQMEGLNSGVGVEAGPPPVASSSSAVAPIATPAAQGVAAKRAQTGGIGGPVSRKKCRTSRGGASMVRITPTATPKPTTPATPESTPIAVPTPSPARDRATSRARNRGEVAVAKPYGCSICNKNFSQKNHLTLHTKTHFQTRSKRRRGSQLTQEEGEEEGKVEDRFQEAEVVVQEKEEGVLEPDEGVQEEVERVLEEEEEVQEEEEGVPQDMEGIEEQPPSTSAAAVVTSETESTGSRTSSRRRLVMVDNEDVGPPPLLSPQGNTVYAENLPSAVGEVGNPAGMSEDDVGVAERGGEESVQGEADAGDGDELEAPILEREVM